MQAAHRASAPTGINILAATRMALTLPWFLACQSLTRGNLCAASQVQVYMQAVLKAAGRADTDGWVIEACRRGDRAAMEMLYHRFKRRIFGMVARICGSQDAEEVAQEVYMRIFRGLAKFRGDSALDTWVYRLTVNAALSHVQRRPFRGRIEGEDALADLPAPEGPTRDPRLARRLEDALGELPAGYRAVLVLHDVEGLSHEEIADIMGCRVGTSKSQLHKARARMRDLLGEGGR